MSLHHDEDEDEDDDDDEDEYEDDDDEDEDDEDEEYINVPSKPFLDMHHLYCYKCMLSPIALNNILGRINLNNLKTVAQCYRMLHIMSGMSGMLQYHN
jgi:hypothetical protein